MAVVATPGAHISETFAAALLQVQAKLLALLASAPLLLLAIVIIVLAIALGNILSKHLHFLSRLSQRNPYLDGLLRVAVKIVVVLMGVLIALDLLGATALVGAVLGSAGMIGLVVGFAFKDLAENYVAGVLLSLRKPFSPGDKVGVDVHIGNVVALTSRATVLLTEDGNHLMLPNSLVFKSVLVNFTRNPKRRFEFDLGLTANAPLHGAMDAGIAALASLQGVLADPAPSALILEVPPEGATLRFMGWIDQTSNDLLKTRSEGLRQVFRALRAGGMAPTENVQRIRLERDSAEPERAHEIQAERDTSVDHALDVQMGQARLEEKGADLLDIPEVADRNQLP
ncbi:MAG: mechanosensitive ion channel family protein [Thermomonas sp.]